MSYPQPPPASPGRPPHPGPDRQERRHRSRAPKGHDHVHGRHRPGPEEHAAARAGGVQVSRPVWTFTPRNSACCPWGGGQPTPEVYADGTGTGSESTRHGAVGGHGWSYPHRTQRPAADRRPLPVGPGHRSAAGVQVPPPGRRRRPSVPPCRRGCRHARAVVGEDRSGRLIVHPQVVVRRERDHAPAAGVDRPDDQPPAPRLPPNDRSGVPSALYRARANTPSVAPTTRTSAPRPPGSRRRIDPGRRRRTRLRTGPLRTPFTPTAAEPAVGQAVQALPGQPDGRPVEARDQQAAARLGGQAITSARGWRGGRSYRLGRRQAGRPRPPPGGGTGGAGELERAADAGRGPATATPEPERRPNPGRAAPAGGRRGPRRTATRHHGSSASDPPIAPHPRRRPGRRFPPCIYCSSHSCFPGRCAAGIFLPLLAAAPRVGGHDSRPLPEEVPVEEFRPLP